MISKILALKQIDWKKIILKLPILGQIHWKETGLKLLILGQAHWKKVITVILIIFMLVIRGFILEITAVNVGNSKLKTVQYVFEEKEKNIFLISGFMKKKPERIITRKELDIFLNAKEIRSVRFFLNILCFFPLMFLFDLNPKTRGSGKLATGKDLFYPQEIAGSNNVHFSHNNGVVIGSYLGKKLVDNSKTHVLLTAPTGSGKGVSIVIPTLVDGCETSCIVADLKGENFNLSSGYREQELNNKCFFLDFSDYKSCSYNPLSIVKKGSKNEYSYASLVATNIVKATTGDSQQEQFWIDSSIMLLQGVILYSLYRVKKRDITMNDVNDFLNRENIKGYVEWLKANFRITRKEALKLADYYDYNDLKLLKKRIHPEIERAFNGILNTPKDTFTSVLMTLKTTLNNFLGQVTREIIKENTFTAKDITFYKKPISLYLKLDFKQIKTLLPIFNIIISSIVTELLPQEKRGKEYYKNKREVMFLLDEFPAFGKIDIIERTITFTRSFGLKYVLVTQDKSQLDKTYDVNSSFWTNCKIKCFFNLDDDEPNIEIISKLTGTKTVKEKPPIFGLLSGKGSQHIRGNYVSKPVISVEEIRGLKNNRAILLMGNKTALIKKIVFFKNKKMLERTKIKPRVSKEL